LTAKTEVIAADEWNSLQEPYPGFLALYQTFGAKKQPLD
jgi:hypothetical protein